MEAPGGDSKLEAEARQLREALASYRALFEQAHDGIFVADAMGSCLEANQAAHKMLGFDAGKLAGQSLLDRIAPTSRYRLESELAGLSPGASVQAECALLRQDGSQLEAELTVRQLSDGRLAGSVRDITRRKAAEAAWRESEARFRSYFELPMIGIAITSLQKGWLEVNDKLCEDLGYPREELTRLTWSELTHPEDLAKDVKQFERVLAGEIDGYSMDKRFIRKNREVMESALSVRCVRKPGGNVDYFVALVQDITARKQAEAAAVATERRYRALIENSHDLVVLLDGNAQMHYLSPSLRRVLGYDPAEWTGRGLFDLLHPLDHERIREDLASLRRAPDTNLSGTLRLKHGDGSWRVLESTSANQLNEPHLKSIVMNFRDVTEFVRAEEQLRQTQKVESIGRLAGGVAHDFNNLLTSIMGFAEMAKSSVQDSAETLRNLERVMESARRGAALTRQLLAFARRQIVSPEPVNLNDVLERMRNLLERLIGEDIELVVLPGPDLHTVKADVGSIEQVVMNLAVNARDAMPRGGRLMLETMNMDLGGAYLREHPEATPGPHVMLCVSDTGTGMAQEVLGKIFEPFFTTKPVGQGTGLGLAMCHGLVKQAGGHIAVYSEVGRGTTFKVYLPTVKEAIAPQAEKPNEGETRRGHETLLLVEDDEFIRDVACQALNGRGYKVLVACNGQEALALAERTPEAIALLITDVVMPKMGGRELAQRLGARRPGLKVLFASGYTENAIVHHGVLQEGINFIPKPYTPTSLAKRVREVLDRK